MYRNPRSQRDVTKGYPVRLSGRAIEVVDTHGLAESLERTDGCRTSLLRFLAKTKKAAFYPPLIVLQTLSEVEMELLRKISLVFTEIVVVFRREDASTLDVLRQCVENEGIEPLSTFHVQSFLHGRSPEALYQRDKYGRDVADILDFYRTLAPSRGGLNLSSPLLAGATLRKMCGRREVKTEIVRPGGENGGLSEDRGLCLSLAEEQRRLTAHLRAVSRANPVIAVLASIASLVTHLGSAIFGFLGSRREEENSVAPTLRRTSQRRLYELWRRPAAGIEIFVGYEYEPWSVVREECLRQTPRVGRYRGTPRSS